MTDTRSLLPAHTVAHLEPAAWAQANRHLVRKAIAEFAHELLLVPEEVASSARPGWRQYRLAAPDQQAQAAPQMADTGDAITPTAQATTPHGRGAPVYTFEAQPMALRHWRIDAATLRRTVGGREQPLDALEFITEFKDVLGIRPDMLPVYLEEISSTLYGSAYKLHKGNRGSPALADADFQVIESSMTEGHPGFVANNGRLGFDAKDYVSYAPEAGAPFAVVWLAVHRDHATFACAADLSYERLMDEELGTERVRQYRQRLGDLGLDAQHYVFMPVHPWQWFNKLSMGFATEIARRRIVCLGYGQDRYQAQQSIRTYFNVSAPRKRYVKTSLSILNMGFMRGLSPYYMSGTPAINDWVKALVEGDPTLRKLGFSILREVASVGYRAPHIEAATPGDSAYRKMMSTLWRESPVGLIAPHERLMSMTALLHTDDQGRALLPELIARSGLDAAQWLRRYLRAYLAPLLHCFYAHDLVFMPHGENLILVLEGHVPVRVIMKDIAEECGVLDASRRDSLPPLVQRIAVDVPQDMKLLAIFIDVFDGFFRHLAQVLVDGGCCTEDDFWSLVAECAIHHQEAHPELRAKFEASDLFAPRFAHSCLNRLQLGNNAHMLNLADPAAGLKMAGELDNPLARFAPRRAAAVSPAAGTTALPAAA